MSEREQFEAALAEKPEVRFWNTTDAMFWAWQAARAQPAQAGQVPITSENGKAPAQGASAITSESGKAGQVLTDDEIDDVQRQTNTAYYAGTLKDRQHSRAIEQAVMAKRVPMQQISDGEFAPDAKLLELADKIDHERNWRHSGIFQRDHLTQDQKDRVLAGVMLRRYADLMAPESWRLFPPKSVVSHSYRAATLEAVVKMAERHGIVGEKGGA